MRYFLLIVLNLSIIIMSFGKLVLEHKWKYADLLWESPQQKQRAIDSGAYNASLMFLFDVDAAPGRLKLFKDLYGRIFLTALREEGTPVSILTVTDQEGEGGPLLRPYPDWSWYRTLPMDGCDGIPGVVYGINVNIKIF
nr:PREDICTED: major royal jelly protein 4-like [Linepithema humile]